MVKLKLSPGQAAAAARAVYSLKDGRSSIEKVFDGMSLTNYFRLDNKAVNLNASTGAFNFKTETGFGLMAMGKGKKFEGHALLACRGTASLKDWLTDFNISMHRSTSGQNVHAGFNRTFQGFRREVKQFIQINRPSVVHCVGHSLGGALANLCADEIVRNQSSPQVALYTFGAPRVGDSRFANRLTLNQKIGTENIHRVYHSSDPVSMIPLWPFMHAPLNTGECYVEKTMGINPFQHMMGNYLKSVGHLNKQKDWGRLRRNHPGWDSHCIEWATSTKASMFGGLNLYNLTMLSKAIQVVVNKVVTAGVTVGAGFVLKGGVTILDQLSFCLHQSSMQSAESKGFVKGIMRRILEMCHVSYPRDASITKTFIRFVLRTLMLTIAAPVRMALNMSE